MNTIKPLKLRHVSGVVTVEAFNRLIDVINAMSDRVYQLETGPHLENQPVDLLDPRRVHTKDYRKTVPE